MWDNLEPHEKNLRVGMVLSDTASLVEHMLEMGWTREKILDVFQSELTKQTGADTDEP